MSWCASELGDADFGDFRLTKRFTTLAQTMLEHPRQSIPSACSDWASSKAAYRFLDNDNVTPSKMLEPRLLRLKERCESHNVVLAVQDSTYLNLDSFRSMDGLGFIESSSKWSHKGLVFHPNVAFSTDGECLGLLGYEIFSRQEKRKSSRHECMRRPIQEKESYRWIKSLKVNKMNTPSHIDVVTVADRESDIYELFQEATKHETFYLVRGSYDRYIYDEEYPSKKEAKISDLTKGSAKTGRYNLEIPAIKGRKARVAQVEVSFFAAKLKPPQRRTGADVEVLMPVTVWVTTVTESNPPADCNPINWVLHTNYPIESIEEACEKVNWYKIRWQIEIYFKVMKSGFKVEKTRFGDVKNLEKFIILIAILATRVMNLTYQARQTTYLKPESFFSITELKVLSILSSIPSFETVRDAAVATAKLGGFLGRKCDGPPGVITMWRGLQKLSDSCEMFEKMQ